MNCKHLIGICSLTHLPCPHVVVTGKCEEAECTNAVVPTWNELVDIYTVAKKPKMARLEAVKSGIKAFVKALGTTMDAKVAVTDQQIDDTYNELLCGYKHNTVKAYIDSVSACIGRDRNIKMEFRKRGKQKPDLDLPQMTKELNDIPQMTEEQRIATNEKMCFLRASKLPSDNVKYIWLWFKTVVGMRDADICQLKWSAFVTKSNGSTWLHFRCTKTGKWAGGKLPERWIAPLRKFVGAPDEYVIPRHAEKMPKTGAVKVKHGEYAGHHRDLREWANDLAHEIGMLNAYGWRKDCSQRLLAEFGPIYESAMLAHDPKEARDHYAEYASLELKDGI